MNTLLDRYTDIVKMKNGNYVYIDTCWTIDHGWETMVFTCNEKGRVTNWTDIDCNIYTTKLEASKGHYVMVNKWNNR